MAGSPPPRRKEGIVPIQFFSHEIVKARSVQLICDGYLFASSNPHIRPSIDFFTIHVDDNFEDLRGVLHPEIIQGAREKLIGRFAR